MGMEMFRKSYAEINLDFLEYNFVQIRSHFPGVFMCPMVKANAYGHGDVPVALALEEMGAKHLGVCLIEEALLLRNHGVRSEVLVFRGFDARGAQKIVEENLTAVVSSWDQLKSLLDVGRSLRKKNISIHLKFDTGMNRLGFDELEAPEIHDFLQNQTCLEPVGVLTHLQQGEDALDNAGKSFQQIKSIVEVQKIFSEFTNNLHVLNSAGLMCQAQVRAQSKKTHYLYDLKLGVRPGLAIYGYNPMNKGLGFELKPVMSLRSQVSVIRKVKKGESISYNGTWVAPVDTYIGVVPLGYADGYHRILSNRSEAIFQGHRVPIVGNICMDYLMVDLTKFMNESDILSRKDQEIVLFGYPDWRNTNADFISCESLAKSAATITWEILTSVGERIPRTFVGQKSALVSNKGRDQ